MDQKQADGTSLDGACWSAWTSKLAERPVSTLFDSVTLKICGDSKAELFQGRDKQIVDRKIIVQLASTVVKGKITCDIIKRRSRQDGNGLRLSLCAHRI